MTKFKPKDKVKVIRNGCNASQFNKGINPLGVYSYTHWEDKIFLIEGTAQLTDFDNIENGLAYLLTDLDENKAGYVYEEAIKSYEEDKGLTGQDILDLERILNKVKELGISA